MKLFLGVISAITLLTAQAQAAVLTIEVREESGDVVFEASGSVDLTGLPAPGSNAISLGSINPGGGELSFGDGTARIVDTYFFPGVATTFGSIGSAVATFGMGDQLGFDFEFNGGVLVAVPDGYVSLAALVASITFENATFASLGITPDSFQLQLNDLNTLVFDSVVPDVPVPAALPLFLAGLASLRFARRKKVRA